MSEEAYYKCKRLKIDAILCSYVGVKHGECRLKMPPEPFKCFFEERYGDKSACDPANWACNKKEKK